MLPEIKLHTTYLWNEFNDEIKRLNHLKGILNNNGQQDQISLTPHNTSKLVQSELSIEQTTMLRQYILHIFQFGTPEERLKILSGIKSKFELTKSKLELK